MSLRSLIGKSLDEIPQDPATAQRLLETADRHIADAKVRQVSTQTRFASAYTATRMLADLALHAHGYRTLTSRPGHHQTAIQTLATTLGIDSPTLIVLDHLRKQRNATEYTGDLIPESAVAECIAQAESLRAIATAWLKANRPALLK